MMTELDIALLLLSQVLLLLVSGAFAAAPLLSDMAAERNGEDEEESGALQKIIRDPVNSYLSLGLARLGLMAVVAIAAVRFADNHLAAGLAGTVSLVGVCVIVPWAMGVLVSLASPERFVWLTRFVAWPLVYLFWPMSFGLLAILRRMSPQLANGVSFPVLPLKKRLELFGYKNGDEDTDEQELMESVFEFGDTRVHEIMVPRIDMVAVNIHMPAREAIDVIVEAGHSRVPVFDDTIDKIVGVIHAKDLLKRMLVTEDFSLSEMTRDVYFVPESKKIDELLTEFKKRKVHLAIAVDEYGGTAGLITLEDILEELVGDIQDEFDMEEEPIRQIDDDTLLCSSRLRLDDLHEKLGLELPEEHADTLGGFLYVSIGRVPRVGEKISYNGLEFEVHSVEGQRIDKVMVRGLKHFTRRVEDGLA